MTAKITVGDAAPDVVLRAVEASDEAAWLAAYSTREPMETVARWTYLVVADARTNEALLFVPVRTALQVGRPRTPGGKFTRRDLRALDAIRQKFVRAGGSAFHVVPDARCDRLTRLAGLPLAARAIE